MYSPILVHLFDTGIGILLVICICMYMYVYAKILCLIMPWLPSGTIRV